MDSRLALAAGHAQPLIWIDDDFGKVTEVMSDATARRLATQVETAIGNLPYSWRNSEMTLTPSRSAAICPTPPTSTYPLRCA